MSTAKVLPIHAQVATITANGKTIDLPIIVGTEGEHAIDIAKLRDQTGMVTFDNGFMNTASCLSSITFLDGENGILKYRGYPIEQLAEKSNFLEVSYLLIYGNLPSEMEMKNFTEEIRSCTEVPYQIKKFIQKYPAHAHPMGILSAMTVSLSAFYTDLAEEELTEKNKQKMIYQMMGTMKCLAAYAYRASQGSTMIESKPKLGYCEDFLNMMFGGKGYKVDPEVANALEVLLILHADHEQNCSTSSVRLVGSSKANLYASIASGINALWGPLHGGANQAVLEMLEEIQKAGGDYKKALARAKDKNDTFRLMGFGHRVYKNFDPRAKIIKTACDTVLAKLGKQDPLLDIARGLEEEALKDPYFVERKLYPNVDFYSGIIYRALGIPTNMFTVMFAIGRLPGWIAQWKEMIENKSTKIGRPRQIYTGEINKKYK